MTMPPERNGALPMPVATPHRPFQAMPSADPSRAFNHMGLPHSPPRHKSDYPTTNPPTPFPRNPTDRRGGGAAAGGRNLRANADTQHVPCKFFLQGTCQAGRTCPFSHDLESTTRPAACKYFAKGGCKFGRKCALLHITPDGTIVNRMPPPNFMHPAHHPYHHQPASQAPPGAYQPAPGLLAQGLEVRPSNEDGVSSPQLDLDYHYRYGSTARNGHDTIDMTLTSASPPTYGSPPLHHHERLVGASPTQHQQHSRGLSVLDAPLPNSFDSNGISLAARNGPFAASVPSRFGIESPPSSLPRVARLGNNTALRDLHSSAFGDRGMDGVLASMGSSPPSGADEPLTFPKRPLHHSERLLRGIEHPLVSTSLGTRLPLTSFDYDKDDSRDPRPQYNSHYHRLSDGELEDDDDADLSDREEDLLPASLRDLIPTDRLSRRPSQRSRVEEPPHSPAAFLAAQRRTISSTSASSHVHINGTTTTAPKDSKVGSPHSSSPGLRYYNTHHNVNGSSITSGNGGSSNGYFARAASTSYPDSSSTNHNPPPTSSYTPGIAHVGSPLRNSSFAGFASSPPTRNGDYLHHRPPHAPGMTLATSPRHQPGALGMSMLTQGLQRTHLGNGGAAGSGRLSSGGASYAGADASTSPGGTTAGPLVRTLSNGSASGPSSPTTTGVRGIGNAALGGGSGGMGAGVGKIDEEEDLFDMDEVIGAGTGGRPVVGSLGGEGGFGAIGAHRAGVR